MSIYFVEKYSRLYRDLALPIKASLWFAICSIVQKGIQFITVPIFTRFLTTNEFGKVALYGSWMSIFVIFITLNLNAGTFNAGMTKFEEDKYAYTSAMQSIILLVGLLFLTTFLCFDSFFISIIRLEKHYLILMISQIVLYSAVSLWTTQQQYQYKFKSLAVVTLLIALSTPILGVWAVMKYDDNVAARIYTMAFVQIVIGMFFMGYNYTKGKTFFHAKYWKFALAFAIPLIPHYLSNVVLAQSDRVMIDWYCSKSDVGIYSVAYSLSMVLMMIVTSINQSLAPWTFKAIKRNSIQDLKRVSTVLAYLVAIPIILLILLAPELIAIIAPAEYGEAVYVIPPVAASCFFIFLYSLFGNIEFYYQKKSYIAIASIVGAALNIVLNLLLIPFFGYIAAAYTTLVCYIGFSLAHYLFSKRISMSELGVETIYENRKLLAISLGVLVFVFLSSAMYGVNAWWRYLVLMLIGASVIYFRNTINTTINQLKKKSNEQG